MQRLASTSATFARNSLLLTQSRRLATAAGPKSFSEKLANGPSLDDFIAGDVETADTIVLGNTSQCV